MGCDIHAYAERRDEHGGWQVVEGLSLFSARCYELYGWLADVRNYAGLPVLAQRRGVPEDASEFVRQEHEDWGCDAHSASWLDVRELLDFDYDQACEYRRVTRLMPSGIHDGGQTCEPGEGEMTTYRALFGSWYFENLLSLKASGAERVVFWFDN